MKVIVIKQTETAISPLKLFHYHYGKIDLPDLSKLG